MRVAIAGATGLIGGALGESLQRDGHQLVLLVRSPEAARKKFPSAQIVIWDAMSGPPSVEELGGLDAVINLAGEPIAGTRWTEARKKKIRDSRVLGSRYLVEALARCYRKPRVLVNASAVGFYGARDSEVLDENSSGGSDFLARVCQEWEDEARRANDLGIRLVLLRTGLVLSTKGGALPKILPPFKAFVGGPIGSGRQFMSWIHIDDEVGAIRYALERESIHGPLNSTAPNPVSNREFSQTLGRVLRRPSFMPVPGVFLKVIFGEMANAVLLEGQRALPRKLQSEGYKFRFPELELALKDLL